MTCWHRMSKRRKKRQALKIQKCAHGWLSMHCAQPELAPAVRIMNQTGWIHLHSHDIVGVHLIGCREKYIEQQMEKRLGRQKKVEAEQPESQAERDEKELYTIPDDLQVCYSKQP